MLAPCKNLLARPLRLVLFAAFVYAFCWIKGWPREYDDEELPPSQRSRHDTPPTVAPDQLVVAVFTTATDVYAKVAPTIVHVDAQDQGTLLHFGDLQMAVGRWPVFDAVASLPWAFIQSTRELAGYVRQLDYHQRGIPLGELTEQDPRRERERLATLAKYKVLPAMSDAWHFRPNRTWYAFVDDDTFIDRSNLLDWLAHHDANTTAFFANPPTYNGPGAPDAFAPFAANGTSFILSGRAMRELLEVRTDVVKTWMPYIAGHSSALELVADVVLRELNTSPQPLSPGMSGFAPSSVPFGPYASWCEPVTMLHHVPVNAASDIWRLQKAHAEDKNATGPLVFAHLWFSFLSTQTLDDPRDDWDNLSSDFTNARWNMLFEGKQHDVHRAIKAETSWEACQASCNKNENCVQWSYSTVPSPNWNENKETRCHLSSSIRLGEHTKPQELTVNGEKKKSTWKSGWKKSMFQAWAKAEQCKPKPQS
ncbi:glycosyltransferase family 31 protein [Dothidotthia symphoricarpi CBS 119687]|uniref:Glycosyltransferase family 31 protein n=1 Tax=Dothidotthia symphoricarpi CBS 119687 TaxID=1392245 RepID=A0A6A6AE40_9PLEO|nr:glycosyltransferase family 31 protein [Dothidotthia symphoricarpi CBS 119687]KAF2129238.1 glycosyltransferase family 31 protein [Dothidotthia symphoricarpi CBS 119687]